MMRDFRPGDQEPLRRLVLTGLRERWGTSAVALYRACGFTDLGDDGTDTHFVLRLH